MLNAKQGFFYGLRGDIRMDISSFGILGRKGLEPSKCNSPVDCCRRRLDGGEPLSAPYGSRCKRVPSGIYNVPPLFGTPEQDSKGRPGRREGKKVSGGHFFSPWESPLIYGRIRYGCGHKSKMFSIHQSIMDIRSTAATPYDVPSGNIGNESLPAYQKRTKL